MSEPPQDPQSADWLTIWQSEAAAMAVDRELREALERGAAFLAAQAALLGAFYDPARLAGAAQPAGAAPLAPAPDARDAAIAALEQRVLELERKRAKRKRR